jgi:hypothetical protein
VAVAVGVAVAVAVGVAVAVAVGVAVAVAVGVAVGVGVWADAGAAFATMRAKTNAMPMAGCRTQCELRFSTPDRRLAPVSQFSGSVMAVGRTGSWVNEQVTTNGRFGVYSNPFDPPGAGENPPRSGGCPRG